MGCQPVQELTPRTSSLDETEEEPDQDSTHSVRSLQVSASEEGSTSTEAVGQRGTQQHNQNQDEATKRKQINWPTSANKTAWTQFDEDINAILEVMPAGPVERRITAMTTLIVNIGLERFKEVQKKSRGKPQPNRREKEIAVIRKELRLLKRRHREACDAEKPGLEDLRKIQREKLHRLRSAENHRKKRRERARKRSQFIANPAKFVQRLLGDNRSGTLQCPKEEVEEHLRRTHSDPLRELDLEDFLLVEPAGPEHEFSLGNPGLDEIKKVIRKSRASSAPGPNGVPYKVYKNCPGLTRRLWKLLKVVWRKGKVIESWTTAEGCFIPKEEESKELSQFRTISLLNVEGKIFLAVIARRITKYMLDNGYIDTSVQKGGVPGVPGCLEHTSALTHIIHEAKKNKGELAVLWLDLSNAYGSIPHKLVQMTLQRYHVPEKVQDLLQDYFNRLKMRFTVGNYVTEWQRLEVGIVTGCTVSVILFASAMNLLIKSVERSSRGPVTGIVRQPPVRAFMDDMTVTAKTVTEGRWMLEDLSRVITWARMKFKPAKSRSLVLKKGKVDNRYRFRVGEETIPTVSEKPVKSLGKWFDSTLRDTQNNKAVLDQVAEWMLKVEKSGLPGKYKAWCFQHGVLPRLLWPLLVYEIPLTTVETMEKKTTTYLRRWLGVPPCFSSAHFFGRSNKLRTPLSSITEEYKVTKVRQQLMLRDSSDTVLQAARIPVRTGSKWSAVDTVAEVESRLRHKDIVGTVTEGRLGLGCITRASWKAANSQERRALVQEEVREMEEEQRQVRVAAMRQQGQWMKWEGARQRKLTWTDLWHREADSIKFLLRSVYDVLPTPTNLVLWGKQEDPGCRLCGKPANLEHVLSSCKKALVEGRYRWRHDKVLDQLGKQLEAATRANKKKKTAGVTFIQFVKTGEEGATRSEEGGLLRTASDWEVLIDLQRRLIFPPEVAATMLRPDIVIWSREARTVVMIELTVPWETRIEEANERKRTKYHPLVQECGQRGWKAWCLPVEIGSRGFPGQSLWKALRILGVTGAVRKRICGDLSKTTEQASRWLWLKREEQWNSQKIPGQES